MAEAYADTKLVQIRVSTARCDRCGCRFEYIPCHVHSTKSGIPRCPRCGGYQKTVTCEETR